MRIVSPVSGTEVSIADLDDVIRSKEAAGRPESRQAILDASLDDWREVMDLALRFSTRCATAYRRGGERTRRLFNAAVLDEVHMP